jgi:hypothetical protein
MPLATASRRRARAQGGNTAGDGLPPAPIGVRRARWDGLTLRRSRPALAAGGVLIVVACAAAGAALSAKASHGSPYLALARPVPIGTPLTTDDLAVVELTPGSGLIAIPAGQEAAVIGMRAAETLQPGSLLQPAQLTTATPVGAGEAVVGASLAANQLPAELQAGDQVLVVLTASSGAPAVVPVTQSGAGAKPGPSSATAGSVGSTSGVAGTVLAVATVVGVSNPAAAQGAGGVGNAASGGSTVVSLAVPAKEAPAVTAASAADEVSLAIVPTANAKTGAHG